MDPGLSLSRGRGDGEIGFPGTSHACVGFLVAASALISLSAISRITAILQPDFTYNWLAAATWSLAFLLVLLGLWLPNWLR